MGAPQPLKLAEPDLNGNERKYLLQAFDSGYLTYKGEWEARFESAIGERTGHPALVASSGTAAIHLALMALGVGHGDEVIVPALTFGTTATAVLAVGAKPVILDVDPETWGLDRSRVLGSLTRKTRAIIPVHIYGLDAGDFRQFGLPVIEDACESLGMVPVRGDMACYSFFANKTITTGEGGALVGKFGNARELRNGGFDEFYRTLHPGLNYRMTNLQAAIGCAQLERLDDLLQIRNRNADLYASLLPGKGRWLFVAQVDDPMKVAEVLKEHGIESRPAFPPLNTHPVFRAFAKDKCKTATKIWERGICLPTGPHVSTDQIKKISELIHGTCNLRRSHVGNRELASSV